MASFADIAIPNVPKHALTYGVPEGLASSVEAGRRVVVPLGRRPVMGFVLAVHDTAPAFRVKAIEEVLDTTPVFSPLLMRLCEWVAQYYCCGLGDALKAALPKGMDIGSERYVSLASDDERVLPGRGHDPRGEPRVLHPRAEPLRRPRDVRRVVRLRGDRRDRNELEERALEGGDVGRGVGEGIVHGRDATTRRGGPTRP